MAMFLSLESVFTALDATPSARCVKEGEGVLNAKHVIACDCVKKTDKQIDIYSLVLKTSAISEPPHTIEMSFEIDEDCVTGVKKMSCSCKAGAGGKCKHIAAVLLYCTRNNIKQFQLMSCTDKKCMWNKRKGPSLDQYSPVPITDTECFRKDQLEPETSGNNVIADELFDKLFPNSALAKHRNGRKQLQAKPDGAHKFPAQSEMCVTITETLSSKQLEMLKALEIICNEDDNLLMNYSADLDIGPLYDCCNDFYTTHIVCHNVINLCLSTATDKRKWNKERQFRITGSRCYEIYTFKKAEWDLKAAKYFWPKIYKIKNCEYGIAHEGPARETYKTVTGQHVIETGLIVSSKNPWIGYSPDGIIMKDGLPFALLEIKSILKGKEMTAAEAIQHCPFILKKSDGSYDIKKKHKYYGQVQLGMAILNLRACEFVIYASVDKSIFVINIEQDYNFTYDLLKTLKVKYFSNMLHVTCAH